MNIVGIFVGLGADICGDIHVRCWRKAAAVRLVVAVGGCKVALMWADDANPRRGSHGDVAL